VGTNPDMVRGMVQYSFTAPFYAGVGYSLASWISLHPALGKKVLRILGHWLRWKTRH
jgi:hypothetical protein